MRETMAASPRAWAVGGHSRGGMLAAKFAAAHPDLPSGLVLLGTTHPRELNLSGIPPTVPVVKVFGSHDGVATPEDVQKVQDRVTALENAGETVTGLPDFDELVRAGKVKLVDLKQEYIDYFLRRSSET